MAIKKIVKRSRVLKHKNVKKKPVKVVNEPSKQPPKIPKTNNAMLLAREVHFARSLANNDKRIRDKVLKSLKKWLTVRSNSSFAFTEEDFLRLWKGLFYCMWMSDKPLIQEELAESLSKIVHCFHSIDVALLYTDCAIKTLAVKWFGIDQYRIDKFAMLARKIIRQTFEMCKRNSWSKDWIMGVSNIIEKMLLDKQTTLGFSMHITEIFWEELSKISGGKIQEDTVSDLIKPFVVHLAEMHDEPQMRHTMKHIFRYLIFQSDIGMDYAEKFEAWKQAGFPSGKIDAMQKIELSDDECDEEEKEEISQNDSDLESKPLDPRAGRVDVELPQLPFNAKQIADLLIKYRFHSPSTTKARRQIVRLHKEFLELANGNMPLGIKEIRIPKINKSDTDPKKAAFRLLEFEQELYSDANKNRKKRKQNEEIEETGITFPSNENQELNNENDDTNRMENQNSKKKQKKNHIKEFDSPSKTKVISTSKSETKKQKKPSSGKKVMPQHPLEHESLKNSFNKIDKKKQKGKLNKTDVGNTNKMKKLISSIKSTKLKRLKPCGKWNVSDSVLESPKESHSNALAVRSDREVQMMNKVLQTCSTSTMKNVDKKDVKSSISTTNMSSPIESNKKKRVKIELQRNTAQNTSEYIRQIRLRPGIPFDANKKPPTGVLKASHIPSPINPFYKKKF